MSPPPLEKQSSTASTASKKNNNNNNKSSSSCCSSSNSPKENNNNNKPNNDNNNDNDDSQEDKFKKFEGDGVVFKAKLVGTELVMEPRGDKMCQNSIQRLKAIIKGQKAHKRRIVMKISYLGVKIYDEKTNEILHHHEVPQISFIASDDTDTRTFGYVCDVPSKAHQFICFKTSGPAIQVMSVISSLFEAVLEKKRREKEASEDGSAKEKAVDSSSSSSAAAAAATHGDSNTNNKTNEDEDSKKESKLTKVDSLTGDLDGLEFVWTPPPPPPVHFGAFDLASALEAGQQPKPSLNTPPNISHSPFGGPPPHTQQQQQQQQQHNMNYNYQPPLHSHHYQPQHQHPHNQQQQQQPPQQQPLGRATNASQQSGLDLVSGQLGYLVLGGPTSGNNNNNNNNNNTINASNNIYSSQTAAGGRGATRAGGEGPPNMVSVDSAFSGSMSNNTTSSPSFTSSCTSTSTSNQTNHNDSTDKYAVFNDIENLPSIFEGHSASSSMAGLASATPSMMVPPSALRPLNHSSSQGLIVGSAPMSGHQLNQHARFSSSMAANMHQRFGSSAASMHSVGSAGGLSRQTNPFDDDFFA